MVTKSQLEKYHTAVKRWYCRTEIGKGYWERVRKVLVNLWTSNLCRAKGGRLLDYCHHRYLYTVLYKCYHSYLASQIRMTTWCKVLHSDEGDNGCFYNPSLLFCEIVLSSLFAKKWQFFHFADCLEKLFLIFDYLLFADQLSSKAS